MFFFSLPLGLFYKGDDRYRVRNGSCCGNFFWSCLLPGKSLQLGNVSSLLLGISYKISTLKASVLASGPWLARAFLEKSYFHKTLSCSSQQRCSSFALFIPIFGCLASYVFPHCFPQLQSSLRPALLGLSESALTAASHLSKVMWLVATVLDRTSITEYFHHHSIVLESSKRISALIDGDFT